MVAGDSSRAPLMTGSGNPKKITSTIGQSTSDFLCGALVTEITPLKYSQRFLIDFKTHNWTLSVARAIDGGWSCMCSEDVRGMMRFVPSSSSLYSIICVSSYVRGDVLSDPVREVA